MAWNSEFRLLLHPNPIPLLENKWSIEICSLAQTSMLNFTSTLFRFTISHGSCPRWLEIYQCCGHLYWDTRGSPKGLAMHTCPSVFRKWCQIVESLLQILKPLCTQPFFLIVHLTAPLKKTCVKSCYDDKPSAYQLSPFKRKKLNGRCS